MNRCAELEAPSSGAKGHALGRSTRRRRRAAATPAASSSDQRSKPAGVELCAVRQPQPVSRGGVVGTDPVPDAPERVPAAPLIGLVPAAAEIAPALPEAPPLPAPLGAPSRP